MPRFWPACLALLLAPLAAADATELKPKLGDIGGAFYAEVSESREVCRSAVEGRIVLCGLNTSFEDDTENRKHARCLPVFGWQAESCAAHFRRQAGKCDGQGPARIDGFTRFGCTVAAEAAVESSEPAVAPGDRAIQARDPAAALSPKCVAMSPGAACWQELSDPQGCRFWYDHYDPRAGWTWSGACRAGVAEGRGVLAATSAGESAELFGAFEGGRMQGLWIVRYADGRFTQGPYLDGRKHGRWVDRYANGRVDEGSYANGRKHGRWVDRYASGNSFEYEYRDGSVDEQPGVYVTGSGERRPGRWSGNCFLDGEGRLLVWRGDRETCPPG